MVVKKRWYKVVNDDFDNRVCGGWVGGGEGVGGRWGLWIGLSR